MSDNTAGQLSECRKAIGFSYCRKALRFSDLRGLFLLSEGASLFRPTRAMFRWIFAAVGMFLSVTALASPGCQSLNGENGTATQPLTSIVTVLSNGQMNAGDVVQVNWKSLAGVNQSSVLNQTSPSTVLFWSEVAFSDPGDTASGSHTIPASATYSVEVDTGNLNDDASVSYALTCTSIAPTLTGISPTSGPGGTVTLTGTGFYGTSAVTFGSLPAASFTVDSDTSITATTPAGTGAVVVTVTTDAGTTTATNVTYTYNVPNITLTPTALPNGAYQTAYSQTVAASGGTAPYSYAVTSGSLPIGLSLGSTTGTLSGTPTTAGSYPFTVTATDAIGYTGSQSYSVSVAQASQTITAFAAAPTNPTYAPNGTFTVSATGGASANPVTFSIAAPSASVCSISGNTVTTLAGGTCTVLADQAGNTNYSAAPEVSLPVMIAPATSTTALTSSTASSVFGQTVTLTATITSANSAASGSVAFKDGSTALPGCSAVNLSGSQAQCQTASLSVGAHSLTATYSGDTNTTGSANATALPVVVSKAATSVTVTPPAAITLGNTLSVSASVAITSPGAGTLTGTVTISDGGSATGDSCTITLPATSCSLAPSSAGTATLTATYSGDSDFVTSTGTASLSVGTATSAITLTSSPNPSTVGQAVTFTATVSTVAPTSVGSTASRLHAAALAGIGKAQAASTLPTGSVAFSDGGTLLATVTLNASGVATYSTTALTAGSHTISARYSGDLNNAVATITDVQQVNSPSPPPASAVAAPTLSTWMLALLGLSLVSAGVGYARRRTMR